MVTRVGPVRLRLLALADGVRVVVAGRCYWTSCRRARASLAVTGGGAWADKQLT